MSGEVLIVSVQDSCRTVYFISNKCLKALNVIRYHDLSFIIFLLFSFKLFGPPVCLFQHPLFRLLSPV